MSKAALYLEFLAHHATSQLAERLDPTEQRIVEIFSNSWRTGTPITVMAAMQSDPKISPSTIHRRLKTLRAKGMIDLVPETADTRIKYVQPSATLLQLFEQAGAALAQVAQG